MVYHNGLHRPRRAISRRRPSIRQTGVPVSRLHRAALAEVTEKFLGRYLDGWQSHRKERFERQRQMGMFPENTRLAPLDPGTPEWDSIEEKEEMDLRMALHAAMVHLVDEGVGRVVDKLRERGELDNTLILFLTDNGASAEGGGTGFVRSDRGDPSAKTGTPESYVSYGIAGANLCDAPFRKYKMYTHEGGIATPLVAHWPNGIPRELNGQFSHETGHVIDFLPTCLELAGLEYPEEHEGIRLIPVAGKSLLPALKGNALGRRELYFEHQGNAAVRIGDWKLVREHNRPWELYDLATDRTELDNLAERNPAKADQLEKNWQTWADEVGVRPWPVRRE